MTLVRPPEPPKLYDKQHAAIYAPHRVMWIPAGTKSGKTAGCVHLAYSMSVSYPDHATLWTEPTYAAARQIGYERLFSMLERSDPKRTVWEPKTADLEIHFRNRSFVRFKGGDEPDSIYGPDYNLAIIDEASRCKEALYIAVMSTLTATNGYLRAIGNVKGRRNWFWKGYTAAKAGRPGHGHALLTSMDAVRANVFGANAIEDARRSLPPEVFRELYEAVPTEDGANPFGIEAIGRCIREGGGPVVVWGIDLAKSHDWTVACGLDDTGAVVELHRWQAPWEITKPRLAELIGDTPALVDSTGVGDPIVEWLQTQCPAVEGFKFTPESKQVLMIGLASAFQCGEVGIPDGWLREEAESFEFEYNATGKVRYSSPDGLTDDGVCALALAVEHRRCAAANRFSFEVI